MSNRSYLLEQVELLKNELNKAVSSNNSLKNDNVIELSHRIDDLVIRLSSKDIM